MPGSWTSLSSTPLATVDQVTRESGLDLNTMQVAYHVGRLQGQGKIMVQQDPRSPGDVQLWKLKIKYQRVILAHQEGFFDGVVL
jgi:hypothetical protein